MVVLATQQLECKHAVVLTGRTRGFTLVLCTQNEKDEIPSRRKIPTVITVQGQPTIWCTEVNHLSEILQGACAIVDTLVFQAQPHFTTLSHRRQDSQKNVIEHKICVLSFCKFFVRNISHSKKNSARYYHKCA